MVQNLTPRCLVWVNSCRKYHGRKALTNYGFRQDSQDEQDFTVRPEAGQAITHRLWRGGVSGEERRHDPRNGLEMSCQSEWSGPHRRFNLREADACFGSLFRSDLINYPVNPVKQGFVVALGLSNCIHGVRDTHTK